ncbi:fibrous sheath CABYR-binding protein [Aedes albopictus]|uniref:Uncharacterized protein n=1 Tax=Aedes albopictus TaxID=7160 RepID=A0ABM1ZD37_AEDAL
MDQIDDELVNSIVEEVEKEVSYDVLLERQKMLLLTRREIEDWKRIVYETNRCREQYLREYRLARKQIRELYNPINRINDPSLEAIIDQHLGQWMENDGKPVDHQPEIARMRAKIERMKQRIQTYEDSYEQIQKSKSHQLAKEISRKVGEEERKIEERQKEIEHLWKARRVEAKKEWENEMKVYVELCRLYTEFAQMEMEQEAMAQNNEIKRAKIVHLGEEIKQAKIEQEEEAKRREIELNERLLIPVKLQHITLEDPVFKDPNDFPVLIDKIERTRKTYEHIFKRPEYMDLRKLRKKNRKILSKSSSQLALLFSAPKRKDKSRKASTQPAAAKVSVAPTTKEIASKPRKELRPPVKEVKDISVPKPMKIDQPEVQVESSPEPSQKEPPCQPSPQSPEVLSQSVPPAGNRRKSLEHKETKAVEEQHKPVCNVQGQQIKQPSAQLMSLPREPQDKPIQKEQPRKRLSRETPMSQPCAQPVEPQEKPSQKEPPRKRLSRETPIPSSAPARTESKKPHKVQQLSPEPIPKKAIANEPQTQSFEFDSESFSFSPEKPKRKSKSQPPAEPMDFEAAPQPQPSEEGDNFSLGSGSPPAEDRHRQSGGKGDTGDFLDSVSLSGSISSFDMEDRESGSDLGFDLSPVGLRTGGNRKGGSDASNEGDSDFDFLASPPKSGGPAGKKGQDSFDFMDGDDSGTGFDFF